MSEQASGPASASLGRRAVANTLDWLAWAVGVYWLSDGLAALGAVGLVLPVLGLGTVAWFAAGWARGWTPGMTLCSLRLVAMRDGKDAPLGRVVARALLVLLFIVTAIVPLAFGFGDPPAGGYSPMDLAPVALMEFAFLAQLAGYLWALAGRHGRTLQDRLLGLMVVRRGART